LWSTVPSVILCRGDHSFETFVRCWRRAGAGTAGAIAHSLAGLSIARPARTRVCTSGYCGAQMQVEGPAAMLSVTIADAVSTGPYDIEVCDGRCERQRERNAELGWGLGVDGWESGAPKASGRIGRACD
jgi:hypothetical protein